MLYLKHIQIYAFRNSFPSKDEWGKILRCDITNQPLNWYRTINILRFIQLRNFLTNFCPPYTLSEALGLLYLMAILQEVWRIFLIVHLKKITHINIQGLIESESFILTFWFSFLSSIICFSWALTSLSFSLLCLMAVFFLSSMNFFVLFWFFSFNRLKCNKKVTF